MTSPSPVFFGKMTSPEKAHLKILQEKGRFPSEEDEEEEEEEEDEDEVVASQLGANVSPSKVFPKLPSPSPPPKPPLSKHSPTKPFPRLSSPPQLQKNNQLHSLKSLLEEPDFSPKKDPYTFQQPPVSPIKALGRLRASASSSRLPVRQLTPTLNATNASNNNNSNSNSNKVNAAKSSSAASTNVTTRTRAHSTINATRNSANPFIKKEKTTIATTTASATTNTTTTASQSQKEDPAKEKKLSDVQLKQLTNKNTAQNRKHYNKFDTVTVYKDIPRPPSPSDRIRKGSNANNKKLTKEMRQERANKRAAVRESLGSAPSPDTSSSSNKENAADSTTSTSTSTNDDDNENCAAQQPPTSHFLGAGDDEVYVSPVKRFADIGISSRSTSASSDTSSTTSSSRRKMVKWDKKLILDPDDVKQEAVDKAIIKDRSNLDNFGNVPYAKQPLSPFVERTRVEVTKIIYADD